MTERRIDAPAVAAAAIAAGAEPDWLQLRESTPGPDETLLDELQHISSIAAFHERLQSEGDICRDVFPADRNSSLGTWGQLILREELGRGAFGRVYRAWDPRIEREVALKVLDTRHSLGSNNAKPVIEEGRLLARVRHPNIVNVFGAESIDGRVGVEMELLSGLSLDTLVGQQGPFGAEEAALIGRAVCRALAAVHRAGLVHRDVKAQNVMREAGGRIVLMDLGSSTECRSEGQGLTGTPMYLAPEILTGGQATPASDLYSLGVLLFFLVSGQYPFAARTLEELRQAHAAGASSRLRDVRPDLPQGFVQVVERATAPSPAHRFRTAADFEAALTTALEAPAAVAYQSRAPWRGLVAAAVVAVSGMSIWLAFPHRKGETAPAPERFAVDLTERLTVPSAPGAAPVTVSKDGRFLAYAVLIRGVGSQIYVRPFGSVKATLIGGTGDSGQPFLSPDGRFVGYHQTAAPGGRMMISPTSGGGDPTPIGEWPRPGGATWADGGTIVYSSAGDLWRVPSTGGTPVRLTMMNAEAGEFAIRPQALRGGEILFTVRRRGEQEQVAALTSDGVVTRLAEGSDPHHMEPDLVVFRRANRLMAARLDLRARKFQSSEAQVGVSASEWFAVSEAGALVEGAPGFPPAADVRPHLVWVDRNTGAETPVTVPKQDDYLPGSLRLSPDGTRFAVVVRAAGAETVDGDEAGRIWIAELRRNTLLPLTVRRARPLGWTRDGRSVTYVNEQGDLVRRVADASMPEEVLAPASTGAFDTCRRSEWTLDEAQVILACGATLKVLTLRAPDAPTLRTWLAEDFKEGAPVLSPDGHWLAFESNRGGRRNLFIAPFPGPGPAIPVVPQGAPDAAWRHDELLLIWDSGPTSIPIRTHPSLTVGVPKRLVRPFPYITGAGTLGFHVSPDGRGFLVFKGESRYGPQALTRINVTLHWAGEVLSVLTRPAQRQASTR